MPSGFHQEGPVHPVPASVPCTGRRKNGRICGHTVKHHVYLYSISDRDYYLCEVPGCGCGTQYLIDAHEVRPGETPESAMLRISQGYS